MDPRGNLRSHGAWLCYIGKRSPDFAAKRCNCKKKQERARERESYASKKHKKWAEQVRPPFRDEIFAQICDTMLTHTVHHCVCTNTRAALNASLLFCTPLSAPSSSGLFSCFGEWGHSLQPALGGQFRTDSDALALPSTPLPPPLSFFRLAPPIAVSVSLDCSYTCNGRGREWVRRGTMHSHSGSYVVKLS